MKGIQATGIACVGRILKTGIWVLQHSPQSVIRPFWVNLLGRRLTANLPIRGKLLAPDEKAAYPSWASIVPNLTQTDIRIKYALN